MADNGEKKTQKILESIQYLIGDNKHLREELLEFARKADEDRRTSTEDRRTSDKRFDLMLGRMDQERARSDERFAALLDQVKRTNRVAVEIARDIRSKLVEGQSQTHRLLNAILKRLPSPNGK